MKTTFYIFTLTVLCVTLICPQHSFAQRFIDGQIPDTFLNVGHSVSGIEFSPDGATIASWNSGSPVTLWDAATGKPKTTLGTRQPGGPSEIGVSVAFSPDGQMIASGGEISTILLWNPATREHIRTLKGLEVSWENVNSVAFSPDGQTLASGSSDDTVKLWDVATGTLKTTLEGHANWYCVAFSPDGTTLASAGGLFYDYYIDQRNEGVDNRIENLLEAQILMKGYGNLPLSVEKMPHNILYITTYKSSIVLWDVASGKLKATLEGHTGFVNSVVFSSDGTTLVSGGDDNTVKLWDVTRQPKAPKATLSDHGASVLSIYLSPDGTTLASGSADGAIRIWKALPPDNRDGVVSIADLVEVAQNFGQAGENDADINGDGVVNIVDIILVAVALGEVAGAPAAHAEAFLMLTAAEVEQWLIEAKQLQNEDPRYFRGILFLEQLLTTLTPKKTMLFPNYPNPFNPETWIPYQLSKPAEVTLHIYGVNGALIRTLALGHQQAGAYTDRSRAAYWDGRNALGESIASGVYFYTFVAGDFTATRKMLIRK